MKVKSNPLTGNVVKPASRFTVSFEKPPPTENYFQNDLKKLPIFHLNDPLPSFGKPMIFVDKNFLESRFGFTS